MSRSRLASAESFSSLSPLIAASPSRLGALARLVLVVGALRAPGRLLIGVVREDQAEPVELVFDEVVAIAQRQTPSEHRQRIP